MKIACDIDGTLSNPDHRLHFIQPKGEDCTVCEGTWQRHDSGHQKGNVDHTRTGSCIYAKKDWDGFYAACVDDTPIPHTVELIQELLSAGEGLGVDGCSPPSHTVEFWTGRNENVRLLTLKWLTDHIGWSVNECALKMRSKGDRRPDHVLKMEFIDPLDPPDIIFEDRSTVVKAYRELGLTVFQVAEGDF